METSNLKNKKYIYITIFIIIILSFSYWLYCSNDSKAIDYSEKIVREQQVKEDECVERIKENMSKILSLATFEQYPVNEVYTGKIAPLDLNSSETANNFRTTIRASLKGGVNFAGHYVISEWGFTGYGDEMAVIDVYNGKVYPFPYMAWAGFQYMSTSSLLVVNPKENILEYNKSYCQPYSEDLKPYYFVWENNAFQALQKDTPDPSVH